MRVPSGYKICPGLTDEIKFKTKNLREWGVPFSRMDSRTCLLWHIPCNLRRPTGDPLRDVCAPCRRLKHDLDRLAKRNEALSEEDKLSR